MTNYNKATLITFFQQGDVPSGTDYANFINSCVNMVETSEQDMAGALGVTELIASRVSAGNINCTGILSTSTFSLSGTLNAASVSANGDITSLGRVTASAATLTNGVIQSVGIVSAAGITQGTAAMLTNVINNGQGTSDGVTTGFAIPANRTGLTQYLVHKGAVSGNLWPPIGGIINSLSTNAPFPLVAGTSYTIMHIAASAYGVK